MTPHDWVFPCKLRPTPGPRGHPTGVVDGDTIDVWLDRGFGDWSKKRVRFGPDIDAPESRTRNPEEKKRGLETKRRLIEKLQAAEVLQVHSIKWTGKYARFIGTVYADGENITEWLLAEGLATVKRY